jgi:hypothetical protein
MTYETKPRVSLAFAHVFFPLPLSLLPPTCPFNRLPTLSSALLTPWAPKSSIAVQNETVETNETNETEYFCTPGVQQKCGTCSVSALGAHGLPSAKQEQSRVHDVLHGVHCCRQKLIGNNLIRVRREGSFQPSTPGKA